MHPPAPPSSSADRALGRGRLRFARLLKLTSSERPLRTGPLQMGNGDSPLASWFSPRWPAQQRLAMSARCCVAGACRLIDFCHDAKLFRDTTFGAGPTLRGRSTQECPEKLGCQLVVLVAFCHLAYALE